MRTLATALRRAAAVLDMTEVEAYTAYLTHVRACHAGCSFKTGRVCKVGLRLHDGWKRLERRESAPAGSRQ